MTALESLALLVADLHTQLRATQEEIVRLRDTYEGGSARPGDTWAPVPDNGRPPQ